MAKIVNTITYDDPHMRFDHIRSFVTCNGYIGLFTQKGTGVMLIEDTAYDFDPHFIGSATRFDSIESLDKAVYDAIQDHICEVFTSSSYTIRLDHDDE